MLPWPWPLDQLEFRHGSGQHQRLKVLPAKDGRRRRGQILRPIIGVALLFREFVKYGRVLPVERVKVDVWPPDGDEREEQDVPVDGVGSVDAAVLQLVALVGEPFDRR